MTPMSDFFHAIAWLFEKVLFLPLDALRELENSSWALANLLNWFFILIAAVAFTYWMMQLKGFQDDEEREAEQHYGKYQVRD